jgi:hypothetical protein
LIAAFLVFSVLRENLQVPDSTDPLDQFGRFSDLEWDEWYALTPQQRWEESQKLWMTYVALGGSLEPDPDPQSPFYDPETWRPEPPDGRPGMRVLRRSGI